MKKRHAFIGILVLLLAGCAANSTVAPTLTPVEMPSPTLTSTVTVTPTSSPTPTISPTPTEAPPMTFVFYGDSDLKVGEVGREAEVGFSFVDNLKPALEPANTVIVANYGGRTAKWGYENLEQSVLRFNPDVVTIWWGINDLHGCPGFFDRETNQLLQYKLTAWVDEHAQNLKLQTDVLLDRGARVFILTAMPVLGEMPWSHLGPNGELIWENDRRCDYNAGLGQLAEAQRNLVAEYSAEQKPVYLVDVWQIYRDHPNTDKMYMDIVHPASRGVELIAEEWLRIFRSLKR